MPRQSRCSHKQRRQSRKQHRRSQKQRGGGSCAAMPLNREVFAQRGGMAPYSTGDATLLDKASMIQAESWQQTADIARAQVLAKQGGGARRYRRRSAHRRSAHRRSAHRRSAHRRSAHRRSAHRKHHKGSRSAHRRSQRGGNYPWSTGLQEFSSPYTLVPAGTATGVNPQFANEGSVNPLYSETRGPQY